jgi:hypothetical protein
MNETYEGKGLLGSVTHWFANPFTQEGDPLNWLLFAGIFMILAFLWQQILLRIKFD